MKLIVGLGNPGSKYKKTRHNLGFRVIDEILEKLSEKTKKCKRTDTERVKVFFGRKEIMLAKPRAFMNNSGGPVAKLLNFYKIDPAETWIIYDDIDLPLGKIRIRKKGSSGGHKGIDSIINSLGTDHFNRLKIGIGSNRERKIPAEKYVLQDFRKEEKETIDEAVLQASKMLLEKIK